MCGSRAAPDSEKDTGDMLKDAVDNPESGIISIEKDIRMEEFGVPTVPSNRSSPPSSRALIRRHSRGPLRLRLCPRRPTPRV
jgi:hypothetical protein